MQVHPSMLVALEGSIQAFLIDTTSLFQAFIFIAVSAKPLRTMELFKQVDMILNPDQFYKSLILINSFELVVLQKKS